MAQTSLEQLKKWYSEEEYQKVVDAAPEIPEAERGYEWKRLLAFAYNETGEYYEAANLLLEVQDQGEKDPLWLYHLGFAYYYLDMEDIAKTLFERVLEMEPENARCGEFIEACDYQIALKEKIDVRAEGHEEEEDVPLDDPGYIVENLFRNMDARDAEIIDGALVLADCRVTIRAELQRLDEKGAVIYYYLDSPDWDRRIFECSVGAGSSMRRSFSLAQSGFMYGMLNGVRTMTAARPFERIETQFAGERHGWSAYRSNLVGMGDTPQESEFELFWNLLRDDIIARLGNQKMCYIKIYGAKGRKNITGECRINDVAIPALGEKVANVVKGWRTREFGAQKQFIYLVQDEQTYTPYPYDEKQIAERTGQAIRLFGACVDKDMFEEYFDLLCRKLGDHSLAEEFGAFLPEMCAENAFSSIDFGETFNICQSNGDTSYYKSQLASYYPMQKALEEELGCDYFTDELFQAFVSVSSTYNVINNARLQGADLERDGARITLNYGFSDEYEVR